MVVGVHAHSPADDGDEGRNCLIPEITDAAIHCTTALPGDAINRCVWQRERSAHAGIVTGSSKTHVW